MVDAERLAALLERVAEDIGRLQSYAKSARGSTPLDDELLDGVKYRFVTSIEGLVSAGQHLLASQQLRAPTSYSDTFAVLAEAELLSSEHAALASRMAGFRHILVHEYAVVDDGQVVELLRERLDDLLTIRAALAAAGSAPDSERKST